MKAKFFMKKLDLKKYWLVDRFIDTGVAEQCFYRLFMHYDKPERHYHNLDHIRSLLVHWESFKKQLDKPELVLWAIYYHDIIYEVKRRDNEQQSARYAQDDFRFTDIKPEDQAAIIAMILATEQHLPSAEAANDLKYFLDFDLAILGVVRDEYQAYAQKIREEYVVYPDEVYFPGRKRVLERLLSRDYLFQTEIFRREYEAQARANIWWEIKRWGDGVIG